MKTKLKEESVGATVAFESPKRRYRSRLERRKIVEETLVPGASVAVIARAHAINANQLFRWRKLYREGRLDVRKTRPQFLPARIVEPIREERPALQEEQRMGTIDIQIGGVRMRITGSADPDCVRAALEQLR